MQVRLHANATTTPKTRRYIQASAASAADLAEELGVRGRSRGACPWAGRRPGPRGAAKARHDGFGFRRHSNNMPSPRT